MLSPNNCAAVRPNRPETRHGYALIIALHSLYKFHALTSSVMGMAMMSVVHGFRLTGSLSNIAVEGLECP